MPKLFYLAVFQPENKEYSVTVPDITGCIAQGDTLEEATDMILEAIGLCLEEAGANIPAASELRSIERKGDDFVVLVAFGRDASRRKHDTRAVKKMLSIPAWLNNLAEEQHVNFSGVLQQALKEQLNIDRP